MKMKKMQHKMVLFGIAAIGLVQASAALPQTPPPTTAFMSSAGPGDGTPVIRPKIVSSGPIIVTITPILMTSHNSPNWSAAADNVIADARAGTLTSATSVDSPTGYAVIGTNAVSWYNFDWVNFPSWGGTNNPSAPFQNELERTG